MMKSGEISVQEVLSKCWLAIVNLRKSWRLILLFTFLGSLLGLTYSLSKKTRYTAVCTFVLDEMDNNGILSQYSGMASLIGIDIGTDGGGIFKRDNILELYRSRSILKKTLLTKANFNGKTLKLIDRYIEFNRLRKKWQGEDIASVTFVGDPAKFNRKQDSLITLFAEEFNKRHLAVNKPDKKTSIIKVSFRSNDELFAKEFINGLVQNVNDFYIQTKTERASQNLKILKHQTDSIKRILNSSLYGAAAAVDAAPNVNPALTSLRVPSQTKQVDVQANSVIYGEMVKNLELSKISLRQQTPLIQFIDTPVLPLSNDRVSQLKGAVLGALLSFVLTICVLLTHQVLRTILRSPV